MAESMLLKAYSQSNLESENMLFNGIFIKVEIAS
jgi:hypothetical protein